MSDLRKFTMNSAQPSLGTPRLLLRPFTLADAPEVKRMAGRKEIADTTLQIPHPYKDGMAEEWIRTHSDAFTEGRQANFAVTDRQKGHLLGAIGLTLDSESRHGDLGYWIGVKHWGNGYCTEAAEAVLYYGFTQLLLHRIFAHHMARNPASGRVMQKIGMQYEGYQREHVKKSGRFEDLVLYGILKPEYLKRIR